MLGKTVESEAEPRRSNTNTDIHANAYTTQVRKTEFLADTYIRVTPVGRPQSLFRGKKHVLQQKGLQKG